MRVCTIYNGDLRDREPAEIARVALMMFDDTILRIAFEPRLPAISSRDLL